MALKGYTVFCFLFMMAFLHAIERHATNAMPLSTNQTAPVQPHIHNETESTLNTTALANATSITDVLKMTIPVTCPEESVVDFDANRYPQVIHKVRCNGHGTLCVNDEGKLACKEVSNLIRVYRYIGVDSNGKKYYRQEDYLVPIACTCAA